MNRSLTLLAFAALLAATPKPTPTAQPSAPGTTFNVGVWTIHMSSVDVSFKSGDFSTPKQVVMQRDGGDITGDRANGNYKTKRMSLFGHVVMHDSEGNFAGLSDTKPANSSGPATLSADQVQIDGAAKVYTAIGNVHYVQADTVVDAERGTLNDATHDLYLKGNVHVVQGDRNMVAGHVHYNTVTGQAHAEDNVTMQFPSQINPHIATPRPIHIKNPLQRSKPAPTPTPTPTSTP